MNNKGLRYYFLAIAIFLGFIITVQLKSNIAYQGIITISDLVDMKNEIDNYKHENKELTEATNEVMAKYAEYKKNGSSNSDIYNAMKNELEKVDNFIDKEILSGPGIIITLKDSEDPVKAGADPQWYLIHDVDILSIVNELKAAGAEAIAINDERITTTTNIRCGGPTINIDGKRHAIPFVIKAIGDPKTLEAVMLAPDIQLMEEYGIQINIRKVERLELEAYDGSYKLKYQKKAEGGETK